MHLFLYSGDIMNEEDVASTLQNTLSAASFQQQQPEIPKNT